MSRVAWACQARSLGCYWPSECTAFVSSNTPRLQADPLSLNHLFLRERGQGGGATATCPRPPPRVTQHFEYRQQYWW